MPFVVESDIILRTVDKPFPDRVVLGEFATAEQAYQYIEKYLEDTKGLHTHFVRQHVCQYDELEVFIKGGRMVAFNVLLGQFEDMIYIRQI